MKNTFRFATLCLALASSLFAGVSCSEDKMDEINEDTGHTLDCYARFMIPDLELRTAQNVVGGDFNTYFGCYTEYWVGTHNQLYQAELRKAEARSSSTYNNVWADLYTNIRNAKIIISKCEEGGTDEGDALSKAIAQIFLAYNASVATDVFGDTPYSQSGLFEEYPQPVADTQESIYTSIFSLLDEAIAALSDEDITNSLNEYDLVYKGDAESWLKFANGLKARYTMRLIERSSNKSADYQKVIDYVAASFESSDDQAKMTYDGNNMNPLFDFQWSRDGISSSQSMYDKLVARNDPRVNRAYVDSYYWGTFDSTAVVDYLAPNGTPVESQYEYAYNYCMLAEVAPVYYLSYDELLFLKAEAEVCLGNTAAAKATLKEAVEEAFINFEIDIEGALNSPSLNSYGGLEGPTGDPLTRADADTYFDTEVAPLFDENAIKETMLQKYFALCGAGGGATETYNDIRRYNAAGNISLYELANTGKFPLRGAYGNDDVVNNPNIAKLYTDAGNYIFTDPVWWAGGTH